MKVLLQRLKCFLDLHDFDYDDKIRICRHCKLKQKGNYNILEGDFIWRDINVN